MTQYLLHQQRALAAGIQTLDARTKRRSEEIALGVMRQYDLILGFLERIEPVVTDFSELNTFYFPVASEQLLCVYRTPDQPQPVPIELRQPLLMEDGQPISSEQSHYQTDARLRAKRVFKQANVEAFLSFEHPPLAKHPLVDIRGYDEAYRDPVLQLLLAALDGYFPRSYPNGATSLVVCCSVPEQIAAASDRLRNLSGILVLFGDKQSFPQTTHTALADKLKRVFNKYFSEVGQFAIRELEFFLTSLLNQDERIHDNQNRALGFIAHMVAHRFRNYRQIAEYIAQEFPTAEAVAQNPDLYQRKIRAMQNQLNRAEPLEKQLTFIGETPQKISLSVRELVDIFSYMFHKTKEQIESAVYLTSYVPNHLLKETMKAAPPPILEELFHNHMENILRVLDTPEVSDKELILRLYAEGTFICLTLTHHGVPLTPDILEDLQRVVRVRRPSGSGLGMFLSAMIMRHIGGDQVVESPASGDDRGVCVILKFAQ